MKLTKTQTNEPKLITLDQRRALYQSAVIAQDATQVASLLRAGASPDDTYRGRSIFEHAWEAVAAPAVIAKLLKHRNRQVPQHWLWSVLGDDRFGPEHVAAVFDLVPFTGDVADRRNVSRALDVGIFLREDACLAQKIRFMVSKGWQPGTAWYEGKLPFHDYLDKGLLEAAWACVEGGVDPHEHMRADELTSPTTLAYWPEFEARLTAKCRHEQGQGVVVPMVRERRRA
jgi:hypothetical protein